MVGTVNKQRSDGWYLEVRDATKTFGPFMALDAVSIGVSEGEFVSVLGPSGCGKTTLLRVIAGLEDQDSGSVWIGGGDVSREPVAKRGLGIVFQSYALFPNITALKNVQYGLQSARLPCADRVARAMETLDLVGLADQADKYPAQLSGGQQQRVALARALAPRPSLLLLDEPLSALDARVRMRLRGEIRRIHEKLGVTTLMVTHDQEEALTMADRIVVMNNGKIMQYSDPRRLYAEPDNAFVAGFIGAMNFLPGCVRHAGGAEARFLSYRLRYPEGRTMPENDHLTMAIRPEHVRPAMAGDSAENIVRGQVRYIEFRGSVYRVALRVMREAGVPSEHDLEMDVQLKTMDQLDLAEGVEIDVHLPPKHLLAFPGNGRTTPWTRMPEAEAAAYAVA